MSIGVDPIHFAAILGVNLGLANITPPTAPLLYFGSQLGNAPINEMLKPALMMIVCAWIPTPHSHHVHSGPVSLAPTGDSGVLTFSAVERRTRQSKEAAGPGAGGAKAPWHDEER